MPFSFCPLDPYTEQVMMALSVCECFYIYLGDLSRYYEQYIQDKPDWSKPRK